MVGAQPGSAGVGISDEVMRDLVNNGAIDLVAATVAQGAASESARAWWGNFLVQKANEGRGRSGGTADHARSGGRGDQTRG